MPDMPAVKMSKEDAIAFSKLVYDNIQANIKIVSPIFDRTNESDKFFYGILTRQLCFATDISCLISHQYVDNFSSIFILCRAIIDDFMPLHYVITSEDTSEEITKLNADAHNKTFKKLAELSELNESILDGEFPYYPTAESTEELKTNVLANENKDKYFSDKAQFKFKRFHNKRTLIDTYDGKDSHADLYRVYFRWRQLSDYVHYSKFSYDFDVMNQTIEYQYNDINEFLIYAYYGAKLIMKQFESKYDITHVENDQIEGLTIEYLSTINAS